MTTSRALGEGELHRYHEYGDGPASGVGVRERPFDAGDYRPEWVWIAERDSRVPSYPLILPADWRDRPDATADAEDRIAAARASFARCRYRVTGRRYVFV